MKALIGLHHKSQEESTKDLLEDVGYLVDIASDVESMVSLARSGEHNFFYMDLNLGMSGINNIAPARKTYEIVQYRVESGEAIFLAVSGNVETVRAGERYGIPCGEKPFALIQLLEKMKRES